MLVWSTTEYGLEFTHRTEKLKFLQDLARKCHLTPMFKMQPVPGNL